MEHKHNDDFKTVLRTNELKSTPLRLRILELLSKSKIPLSAEEISKNLEVIAFDRATLFRTLKTFVEKEIVHQVDLGEGRSRYEMNCKVHHHHHHIICHSCKHIETVPFCIPDEIKAYLKRKGYTQIGHRLDFSGICKKCH